MTAALQRSNLPPALLQADALPTLPTVAVEVLKLTQDPDATIQDLAKTIGQDPALAGKLLKLANSSLFNPGGEIGTLERATMVLGMKTVKLLSLSFSLVGSLPPGGVQNGFDFGQYWHRSLTAAVAGRSFAKLAGLRTQDEAFLIGLLGELGRLVLATCMVDDYAPVAARNDGWPSIDAEQDELGFTSSDVGMALLKEWDLPSSIYGPVGYRCCPKELPEDSSMELQETVWLSHLAHLTAEVFCGNGSGKALSALLKLGESKFALNTEDIDECLAGMEFAIGETADLLQLELPEGQSHAQLLDNARMQIVNVSLGAAVDLRQAEQRSQRLEQQHVQLKSEANTDVLTGLPNRKAFDEFLAQQIDQRMSGSVPRAIGLVMIDVDHFKLFNDTHGHQAGDEVLRAMGQTLLQATRRGDLAARYGGEEFALIAPQTTPFGIRTMAERLRQAIAETMVEFEGQSMTVTASIGAACVARIEQINDGRALIKLADHYLYKAKENGRNRCEVYPKVQFPGR